MRQWSMWRCAFLWLSLTVCSTGEAGILPERTRLIFSQGVGEISLRLASAMNGIGLLERIPEAEILARAHAGDDGISGRPNEVIDPATGKTMLGRFGWKAAEPSLEAQDAKALDLDIGLSNPIFRDSYGDCTKREPQCLAMPNGASSNRTPSSFSRRRTPTSPIRPSPSCSSKRNIFPMSEPSWRRGESGRRTIPKAGPHI